MKDKLISLTRILAVNWYGFRQIFDVSDDILISGVFGSGKSALLDLMQYVMLGEHWRPNRAAAGAARGRDLRSYCLCDTNTVKDGEPHYTRRSAVTIVGLEFTWPQLKSSDTVRRETWGIRIEYSGPTSEPKQTYFCIPDRVTWAQITSEGKMSDEEDFRSFVRREYGHENLFPRQKDYLEEMHTPQHLYFDRAQLDKTMWKAIAFEPEPDIEKFIRDFILEENLVDVRDVKAAVGAYRETLARLEKQEAEATLLREVSAHHEKMEKAQRTRTLFEYLVNEIDLRRLTEIQEDQSLKLKALDERHASENEEFNRRVEEIKTLKNRLNEFCLDAGEEELRQKESEKKEKYQELSLLREAQQSVRTRLGELEQSWRRWLRQGESLKLSGLPEVLSLDDALLGGLSQGDEIDRLQVIPKLAQKFHDIFMEVEILLSPFRDKLKSDSARLKQIVESLEKLERGETPGAFPLFKAVRDRLAGAKAAPEQLCRLVEVAPEAEKEGWRPALEMYMGRNRFAIVTGSEDQYQQGMEILRRFSTSEKNTDEALIHPREAGELNRAVEPDSLATKVEIVVGNESIKQIVTSYVNHLLGHTIAVESVDLLDQVERGISREGIFKQKPIRRRLRLSSGTEFTLGREGLKRLQQALIQEQSEVMVLRDSQQEMIDRVHGWIDLGKKMGLSDTALPDRSNELGRLPKLQRELNELKARIEFLATPEREQRLKQRSALENSLDAANQAIGQLRTSREGYTSERNNLAESLSATEKALEQVSDNAELGRKGLPVSISDEEIEREVEILLSQNKNWNDRKKAAESRQGAAETEANNAKNERYNARLKLNTAVDADGRPSHPEYRLDFDPLDESNDRWSMRLSLLEGAELPKFRLQAAERKKDWERRLQDQVLNRLNENLNAAERTVRELRQYLDRTVGRYRYRITQRRDPSFHVLWSLLDSGFEPTDELLAATRNMEIQAALDELMAAVEAADKADERARKLLDYRYYHRYDIEMVTIREGQMDSAPISLGRSGRSLSGGEGQAPFFISTLAAFRRVYDRGDERSCHLGLVVMDEAFSKLSGDGVEDCLELARNFNLQLVMAFPIDRLGVMAPFAQTIVLCRKDQQIDAQGYVSRVDNVPILLTSEQVEETMA